ncbi:MAG: M28 family peptidase [Candidatus Electryoneaceae bacterium]|nr:M28 family peptidase [Candidatus Electryoneaceae bacterium]
MKIQVVFMLLCPLLLSAQTPPFDADRAFSYLEHQCAYGPRNPASPGYYACLEWLTENLRELADEIHLQTFNGVDPISGETYHLTNVIARFEGNGSDPLMLCAHWDTRPWADLDPNPDNRNMPILGANDGASGVAVLLEMVQILAEFPPDRTVLITLFDGEDFGRSRHPEEFALGSRYWSQNILPEKPTEAILLDMIGDADLVVPIEPFSERGAPGLRQMLWDMAEQLDLSAFVDYYGPAIQDDHVPLLNVGIRAVDLIDFDYPPWHTLEDTPNKCSPESLEQIGMLLVQFIYGR